jgi:hypothetical protein
MAIIYLYSLSKRSVLSIASKSHQVSPYYINSISIPTNITSFDLGVTICDDLTYQTHFTNIVSKARQRSCMVFYRVDWT